MIKNFWNIKIFAETYSNSYSRWHRAIVEIWWRKIEKKIRYYNRTWENFQFQSVLKDCYYEILENLSRNHLEFYKKDLDEFKKFLYLNDY